MTMNLFPVSSQLVLHYLQRNQLEIIAQNIANSNTTQDADGNVYKRKKLLLKSTLKF